jgi:hypothetical protein
MTTGSECRQCGQQLVISAIPELCGTHEGTQVAFYDVPALTCVVSEHEKRWADPEFGSRMTDDFFYAGRIPVAQSSRGRLVCRKCRNRIKDATVGPVELGGEIHVGNLTPFKAKVSAAGCRCEKCGDVQIYASRPVCTAIGHAIANAFDAALFVP